MYHQIKDFKRRKIRLCGILPWFLFNLSLGKRAALTSVHASQATGKKWWRVVRRRVIKEQLSCWMKI